MNYYKKIYKLLAFKRLSFIHSKMTFYPLKDDLLLIKR